MFSKNNLKMNSTKQSEKINQYGIKKFNAGTASVLIASGFLFLGGAAQAADTTKQETPVETTAKDKSTEKVETPKAEVAEKTADSTVVKTNAVKTKLQEKINRLNDLFVTLAGKDLSETQQKLTVDAAIELNKAKDLIVDENATQAQVDAQAVALENSISFLNKSLEAKKVEDKKVEDKKEAKSEEKSDKKETKSEKEKLEKTISEAKVINQTATAFAEKSVKEESKKAEIKAAVATAEKQIAKALDVFNSDSSTKSDSERERKELERAIEAVYATMQRAGHRGKLEGLLADAAAQNKVVVKPAQVTPVANYQHVTEEEIAEIIRQFRIANPDLTDADKIQVNVNEKSNLVGETTVTLANGQKFTFPTSEVIKGYTANRNTEQLKKSINWFNFGSSRITYPDGTKVGEVKYLSAPVTKVIRDRYGVEQTGVFTYYREVTYADGRKGTTLDDEWLKNGPARYSKHFYNDGRAQSKDGRVDSSKGEFFESLQEGMRFTVKTSVEGYELTATVTSLAPKNVATNPFKDSNGKAYNVMNQDQTATGRRAGDPVDVVLAYQDKSYSHMKTVGLSTDNEDGTPQMTAFTAAYDSANVGVNFSLSATYNSRPVAVNAIAVDAEEAGEIEVLQFETDGTNWEQFLALNKNPKGGNGVVPINSELLGRNGNSFERPGYKRNEWLSTDKNGNVSMYGTKLFGPAWTTINSGNDLPVGISQNVSNISIYMNTQGSQAGTVGFVIYDGGDAPATYGSAQHFIGNLVRTNSDGSSTVATQPYLGSQKGDPDFRSVEKEPSGAWALDDLVNTDKYEKVELQSGRTTVTNEKGETGIYEI